MRLEFDTPFAEKKLIFSSRALLHERFSSGLDGVVIGVAN
jgi:hypothetical protein